MSPTPTTPTDTLDGIMERFRSVVARAAGLLEQSMDRPTSQLTVLDCIGAGTSSVSDVAHVCMTHVSSASRTIHTLVKDGLVDRREDPTDRRAVVLELTPPGRQLRALLNQQRGDLVTSALTDMDDDDRDTLVRLLQQFLVNFETAIDHAVESAPN